MNKCTVSEINQDREKLTSEHLGLYDLANSAKSRKFPRTSKKVAISAALPLEGACRGRHYITLELFTVA